MTDIKKLQEKFFNDPDWKEVETLILGFINPLLEMDTVDTSQPAEHVKAEIIARTKAYTVLTEFLGQTAMVSRNRLPKDINSFK